MQCGNEIVEAGAFVIKTRAALTGDFGQQCGKQYSLAAIIHFGHISHHFQGVQCAARITIDQFRDGFAGIIRQNDILATIAPRLVFHRLTENLFDIFRGQRFEQIDARPRQQRGIQFKRRVFGGCPDKGDRAVFNMR